MAASGTFSVRLPPETRRELEEYAKATKRSSAFVVKEAVEAHLAERRAYLAAIEEGLRDIDEGDTIPGDEIIAWMESWGTENELPPPSTRREKKKAS